MRLPLQILLPLSLVFVAFGQDTTSNSESDTARIASPTMSDSVVAPTEALPSKDSGVILPAAPKPRRSVLKRLTPVAIMAFTGDSIDEKTLSAVTNRFESELLATDSFQILERRNIDKILREQGFQQSGACDNSECSVEIGKLLSVQGIFTGEISKVGKTWSLSVKRTDVGSGETMFSQVLDIRGSLEDLLRGGCPEMALIASGRKKASANRAVLVVQEPPHIWPWIAGGVIATGAVTTAILLMSKSNSSGNSPQQTSTAPDQVVVGW